MKYLKTLTIIIFCCLVFTICPNAKKASKPKSTTYKYTIKIHNKFSTGVHWIKAKNVTLKINGKKVKTWKSIENAKTVTYVSSIKSTKKPSIKIEISATPQGHKKETIKTTRKLHKTSQIFHFNLDNGDQI